MANEIAPLSKSEVSQYADCLDTMKRTQDSVFEYANALWQIKQNDLYRGQFKTFDAFCNVECVFDRRHAYRLIEAAQIVENVSHGTQNVTKILPKNERQARPLAQLEPEKQAAAWQDAVDLAKEREVPITAAIVEEVVAQHVAQSQPYVDEGPPDDEPETEKPKKAEKVKDQNGKTVPEHCNEVFTRGRDEFKAALNLVTQLKKAMNSIAGDQVIGTIFAAKGTAGQACRDLDNVRNALRFATPHAVCPYCKGKGCEPCYQAGWVGERVANSAPPELKK